MARPVAPGLYERYREAVLSYSNGVQRIEDGLVRRGLSDDEIAEKLGLTVAEVEEIRCVAEIDLAELSWWDEAESFKQERCGRFVKRLRT